jgi:hypothetical protein
MVFRDNLHAAHTRLSEAEEEAEFLREELSRLRDENAKIRVALDDEAGAAALARKNAREVRVPDERVAPKSASKASPALRGKILAGIALAVVAYGALLATTGARPAGRPRTSPRAAFDPQEAAAAISRLDTETCGHATGAGHVTIRFASDGHAEAATVTGAAPTTVSCLVDRYKSLRVSPFAETSQTVGATVDVPK